MSPDPALDFDRFRPLLRLHARRLQLDPRVKARFDESDVVQETLLRAWQHPEVIGDTERPVRAWLFTVARNMIIDDRRSARHRNVVGSLDEEGAPEQSTPDEVNAALDRLLIADAMVQLSTEHRAVIERSYYRGWTTAQIAADLDIAEGTVKSRLHYAVRALRLTLQELGVTR